MALSCEGVKFGRLRTLRVGEETRYSINVALFGVEGALDVTAQLTASSTTWTSSVDKLVVRARTPDNTKLHGAMLGGLVAEIRDRVYVELSRLLAEPTRQGGVDLPADPDGKIADSFSKSRITRKRNRHSDEHYVPFALTAVEKMNREATDFPRVSVGKKTYYPRVLYGRLDGTNYDTFTRRNVARYVNACVERDLLVVGAGVDASWSLTEKCQRIAREMGLART